MTSGVASALAAIVLSSQLDSAPPILGQGLELSVISAVLLGGVSFTGGSGSLLGVVAAVAFIGVLDNGLFLVGVPAYWSQVSAGVALVLAAGMNALTSLRRRPGRSRARHGARMNRHASCGGQRGSLRRCASARR